MMEVLTGGVHWHVLPGCEALFFDEQGLRLQEWLQHGQAQVVKHGPHRTVYRLHLSDKSFYLKHYRLSDTRSRLRQLVRDAKARIEFDRARAVALRHIPTIVPVALGICQANGSVGESFLITQALEGAQPLNDFLEEQLSTNRGSANARVRQRLAIALGEFVALLHEAGIEHEDLHAANVLVKLGEDSRPCLYLIDLHAVRLAHPLSRRASCHNLVLLNRYFSLVASRCDRARFWHAYCRIRLTSGHASATTAQLGATIEEQTRRSNQRFWSRRSRRCLGENRYFQKLDSPAGSGNAVSDFLPAELACLLRDPDALLAEPGAIILKDSRSITVAEIDFRVGGIQRRVILKRFRAVKWLDPFLALVRPTHALRSWKAGHALRDRLLPTARPLAVFQRYKLGLPREAYLLTEKIEGASDLWRFVESLRELPPAIQQARLRARLEQVARLLADMHDRNITHRDLKAGNLLATDDGVCLIDLVGVRCGGRLSRSRRAQNLARLHASFRGDPLVTRTEKLRFLRSYLRWGLRGKTGWKAWWLAIAAATDAKVAHNRRSGRPLR